MYDFALVQINLKFDVQFQSSEFFILAAEKRVWFESMNQASIKIGFAVTLEFDPPVILFLVL